MTEVATETTTIDVLVQQQECNGRAKGADGNSTERDRTRVKDGDYLADLGDNR